MTDERTCGGRTDWPTRRRSIRALAATIN